MEEDKEVIIARPDGKFLYRDGVTWGTSVTHACKYRLIEDKVEGQIKQVQEEFGATWKWLDYQKILDSL